MRHFPDERIFGPDGAANDTGGLLEDLIQEVEESPSNSPLDSSFDQVKFNSNTSAIFEGHSDEDRLTSRRALPFSIDELLGILISMLRDGEVIEVYFIIDGLDECGNSTIPKLIQLLTDTMPQLLF